MTAIAKETAPKQTAKTGSSLYRGVRILPVVGRSCFSRDEIRRAVETAIAKNANALAHSG